MLNMITGKYIITGVFNVNIRPNILTPHATDFIAESSCRCYVSLTKPTRRTVHTEACLEQFYIYSELSSVSGVSQVLNPGPDGIFCFGSV